MMSSVGYVGDHRFVIDPQDVNKAAGQLSAHPRRAELGGERTD